MIDSRIASALLATAVAAALIVAVWVSVEDLSATLAADGYCEAEGRRLTYAWAVATGSEPVLVESGSDPCTLVPRPPETVPANARYVLPGNVQLEVSSGGQVVDGEAHMPPAILASPVMAGYAAVGLELLAVLASAAYLGVVLLVWLN